ncbi:MAG: putative metal-binding motif-containing protein [Deltaproteobacteria bacterium]|nr:putative metal-binding motif-containing protein [Deltaproteobacteria bacterium]
MMHRGWIVWVFAAALGFAAGCSDDTTVTDTGRDDVGADADGEADVEDVEDVPTDTGDTAEVEGDVGDTTDVPCLVDEDCDDGLFCTGIERCVDGTCTFGADPCDDAIDCTVDSCDPDLSRCNHVGDDEACQNGIVCDGAETCEVGVGCQPGTRPDCRDDSACTIDSCDEARGGCVHDPRDLDGDTYITDARFGDEDCGGDDCNDSDPTVHPGVPEVCDDIRDNDCDTFADFADDECRPANDTCDGALRLEEDVSVNSSTNGTMANYTTACGSSSYADVVFSIDVTEAIDVIVTVTSRGGTLYADFERAPCGGGSTVSLQCLSGTTITLRRNSLAPGTYYVIVKASSAVDFSISYATDGPTPIPPNDVCSGAYDIDPSAGPVTGTLLDTSNHYIPGCAYSYTYNDVFYRLVLTEPHKITITASLTPTTYSTYLSLMTTCGEVSTELACASGSTSTISRNFLDAGTYYIAVDANSTNPFTLNVRLEDPIYPPANDRCSGAINVSGGGMFLGTLVDTYRDYPPSCSTTTTLSDVVYSFTLAAPQDVAISVAPVGASTTHVAALRTTCDDGTSEIGCRSGNPAQFTRRSLAAGTYYIMVSGPTTAGSQFLLQVTMSAPTPVPPGDVCSTAVDISAGGTFAGTTVACSDDYVPSCGTSVAYVDSVYRFTLATPRDVTLALTSSATTNYLDLRSGACGGGTAIRCVSAAAPSVFNRNVPAGDYWVLVDTSIETPHSLTATFGPPTTACDGAPLINVDYSSSTTFTYTHTGTTAGRPADFDPSCVGGEGPDMAFQLVLPSRSAVTVTSTTTDFDGSLHMRSDCDVASSQIDCDDDCGGTRASCLPSTMTSPTGTGSLTLEAGSYYIIQDAFSTGSGSFTLNVTATRL